MTTPTPVTGYQYVTINPASSGFGEYDARNGQDGDIYADPADMIHEATLEPYVSTQYPDWATNEDNDSELIEAIQEMKGAIHGEPEILVAIRQQVGQEAEEIVVFGINSLDCFELSSGEYVPVSDYDPDRHTLA